MESLQHSLRPLNWDLSLSGCPILPYKRKLVNYLLNLHGFILIINVIVLLFHEEVNIGISSKAPFVIHFMMFVWNLCYIAYCISFILIVWRTRDQLVFLVSKELAPHLIPADHQKIFSFTAKLFLHKLVSLAVIQGTFVTFAIWINTESGMNLRQVLLLLFLLHNPFASTLSLYLALLKTMNLAETNIISRLEQNISKYPPHVVYTSVKKCVQLQNNISKQVSVLLCFMFGYLFVYAVSDICRCQYVYFNEETSALDKTWALVSLFRLAVYFLQATFLVFQTHKLSQEFRKKLSSLADAIVILENSHKWSFVLYEISKAQLYKYRALDFFSIDQDLLLPFSVSFVSLTVLFTQLINQAIT